VEDQAVADVSKNYAARSNNLHPPAEEVEEAVGHEPEEDDQGIEEVAEHLFVEGKGERLVDLSLAGVADPDEVEVVEDGDDRVHGGDDDDREVAGLKGGHEEEELAGQPAGGGDPGEREGSHGQGQGQERRAPGEAAQTVDGEILAPLR
jgi:hypothetical protein